MVVGKLVDHGHKLIILRFEQSILFKPILCYSWYITLFIEIAILDLLMFISLFVHTLILPSNKETEPMKAYPTTGGGIYFKELAIC